MTIYGLGEVMLRYTPYNYTQLKDANSFDVQVGGAELNTLITLSHFGQRTDMLTVLPRHAIGTIALQKMTQANVATHNIKYTDGRLGTYYLEESFGFRSGKIIYDRSHSTFSEYREQILEGIQFESGDYFVFTGITLAVNPMVREQIVNILTQLKQRGVKIVFDINYRSNLWNKDIAKTTIESVLPHVDILLFGKMDATHLLNTNNEIDEMETCARTLQQKYNIPMLASSNRDIESSTLQGIMLNKGDYIIGQSYPYTVLNRIGAGDAFMAGIIHGLISNYEYEKIIDFATKCSVLQHTTREDALTCSEEDILGLSTHIGELKR